MPDRPRINCTTPGCRGTSSAGGRCESCTARRGRAGSGRTTSSRRGYGAVWQRRRVEYLVEHPRCALCGRAATVPDHWPTDRATLVRMGVDDPDADEYLRPLCEPDHRSETAANQPGGWHRSGGRIA
jgi:5-methylcytosine-specific restriction protein A